MCFLQTIIFLTNELVEIGEKDHCRGSVNCKAPNQIILIELSAKHVLSFDLLHQRQLRKLDLHKPKMETNISVIAQNEIDWECIDENESVEDLEDKIDIEKGSNNSLDLEQCIACNEKDEVG